MENQEPKPVESVQPDAKTKPTRPNDFGSVQIDAHFKIYDPNTEQVYVEGRA